MTLTSVYVYTYRNKMYYNIYYIYTYVKIYILLGGHFVGCDRTNTHTHTHTQLTHNTHAHTQTYGRTALHWAAYNGHGGVAEALLKAGCNPLIVDTV